ncbi:MAG TPA: Smr/MutS family protein [Thermoanaerobaculia bacterium]|nr:Smr/MutS family protein [Thermoanaerobaculia bacterium]
MADRTVSRRAGRRPRDGESDRDPFQEAMDGVEPLADRPAPPPGARPSRRRSGRTIARPAAPVRFEIEEDGERVEGRLPGFDRREARRLARGEIAAELTVDLHGFPEAEARGALLDALRRARRAGLRAVRVIHGRGLRSPGGPVLKAALPRWLAEPPLGSWVLAFATAPPEQGGTGATLVLLRTRTKG